MLLPDGSQIPPVPGARLPLPAEVQDRQALPPLALAPPLGRTRPHRATPRPAPQEERGAEAGGGPSAVTASHFHPRTRFSRSSLGFNILFLTLV